MEKYISLNIPIKIDQVERLSKAVAISTANRDKSPENERITKATFIRVLIDIFDFENADLSQISVEENLKAAILKRISEQYEKQVVVETEETEERLSTDKLKQLFESFSDSEEKKWIAGEFINLMFEKGLIKIDSKQHLWLELNKKQD